MMIEKRCDIALLLEFVPERVPAMWVSHCQRSGLCMLRGRAVRVEPKWVGTPVQADLIGITGIIQIGQLPEQEVDLLA